MTSSHVELQGSRRASPQNAVRVRDVDPHEHIEVTVTLKGPDLPPPDQMPTHALTRSEIDSRFGVAPANVQKVERVLRSYGLHISAVMQGGRSLHVGGSASAMMAAFEAKLGVYRLQGNGEMRGREGALMIPAELDGFISGVDGLDQRQMARHQATSAAKLRRDAGVKTSTKVRTTTKTAGTRRRLAAFAATGSGPNGELTPANVQRLYNFPPGDGAGQNIVIAEFGTPLGNGKVLPPAYIPTDVTQFASGHGLPAANVQIKPIDIAPLNQHQYEALVQNPQVGNMLFDQTAETMMDIEIIAALCPKSAIKVCFASWTQKGWIDFLDEVTSGHPATPVVVSISYGLAEDSQDWTANAINSINHRLQIAAMQGITVCVSSGDDGTGCGQNDKRCHVEFPASSPFVLSVGGTMLTPGAGGQALEVVWWEAPGRRTNNGGGSTGGGVSVSNLRPSWQTPHVASLNPAAPDGRIVPDVAALAGPPFFDNLLDGKPLPGGGTSASAPVWASLLALINASLPASKKQRFVVPLLYKTTVATSFRDIVSGQNASSPAPGIGYKAGPGFDAVSGLGVPDGVKLLAALGQV
jgi:kumamolisin